jgi:phosphoglycerate dehydrogenase-like enzyme
LREGVIAGAGLDVTDPEPLPADHPLWHAPNTLITPHMAGASGPVIGARLAKLVGENIERRLAGRPLAHVIAL